MGFVEGVSYFVEKGGYLPHTIREKLTGMEPGSLFHSLTVGYTADVAARHVGIELNEQERLALYGHDIMKMFSPFNELVALKDLFTEEQISLMRQHPEKGYEFWKAHGMPEDAALTVRHHHERFDGKGYPDGLRGDEMPLVTSLLTVADTVDAMIDPTRLYRPALSLNESLGRAQELSGSALHPLAVDIFITTQHYWNNDLYLALQKGRRLNP